MSFDRMRQVEPGVPSPAAPGAPIRGRGGGGSAFDPARGEPRVPESAAASFQAGAGTGPAPSAAEALRQRATVPRGTGQRTPPIHPDEQAPALARVLHGQAAAALPLPLVRRFSAAFGQDLGDVRVHADSELPARAGALALTVGREVAFAPGQYRPGTREGDLLIGHELAHVVQQAGGPAHVQAAGRAGGEHEVEADRAAALAMSGHTGLRLSGVGGVTVQRQTLPGSAPALPKPDVLNRVAPPAGAETLVFEGVTLSTDAAFVRFQLEDLWARKGRFFVTRFVDGLAGSPASDPPALDAARRELAAMDREGAAAPAGGSPVPFVAAPAAGVWRPPPWSPGQVAAAEQRIAHPGRALAVIGVARAQLTRLQEEAQAFSATFGARAEKRLRDILSVSRSQVEAEQKRYGITESVLKVSVKTDEGKTFTSTHTTYGFAAQSSRDAAEMARFAALLQAKREAVAVAAVKGPHAPIGFGGMQIAAPRSPADASVHDQVRAQTEYDALRAEARRRFPILLAFDQDPEALSRVAVGKTPEAAAALGETIREKLDAIHTVEGALDGGDLSVWSLPQIVDGTQRELGVLPKSMRASVIDETVRDKADEKAVSQAIVGAVAFSLGLVAAIPTGGASVALAAVTTAAGVASASLALYQAAQGLQSYVLASAENNTNFDRAMAISQEEPSLFWLAVEIAGAIGSISVALSAFRQLRAALAVPRLGAAELEEFARVARRVLPEESAERAIAAAKAQVKAGLRVTASIRLGGAALSEAQRAQIGLALVRYSEEAYTAAFLELSELGRVRPLTREALVEIYGEAGAAPYIEKYFGQKGVKFGGFYENKGFPGGRGDIIRIHKGVVFIQGDGSLAGVAGKVVHELTHHFQDLYWDSALNLVQFNQELMAHSAQQALLRRVAADAGAGAVPAESRWLLDATEQELRARIVKSYGFGREVEEMSNLVIGQADADAVLRPLVASKMRSIDRQAKVLEALRAKAQP